MTSRRTHIVLSDTLVREIDELVGQRRRSAFLEELAVREVRRRRFLKLLERPGPLWNPADHPEIDEAGGAAGCVRKLRREAERGIIRRKRGRSS